MRRAHSSALASAFGPAIRPQLIPLAVEHEGALSVAFPVARQSQGSRLGSPPSTHYH